MDLTLACCRGHHVGQHHDSAFVVTFLPLPLYRSRLWPGKHKCLVCSVQVDVCSCYNDSFSDSRSCYIECRLRNRRQHPLGSTIPTGMRMLQGQPALQQARTTPKRRDRRCRDYRQCKARSTGIPTYAVSSIASLLPADNADNSCVRFQG